MRSVHEMSESAYKMVEISDTGHLKMVGNLVKNLEEGNMARQQLPKTYVPNGYIDILLTTHIMSQNTLHGMNVAPFITPQSPEVDCEEDFDFLEYQITKNPDLASKIFGDIDER